MWKYINSEEDLSSSPRQFVVLRPAIWDRQSPVERRSGWGCAATQNATIEDDILVFSKTRLQHNMTATVHYWRTRSAQPCGRTPRRP